MNEKNLRPPFTPSLAREIGRKGGQAKAQKAKEKKLLSQVYLEMLAKRFPKTDDEGSKTETGAERIARRLMAIIDEGGSAGVAAAREVREATEGSKSQVEQELKITLDFDTEGL